MRRAFLLAATVAAISAAGPARAGVMQPAPDSTPMPQPSSPTEISLVMARGFSADADTLAGLFKSFNGGADAALDPTNDAATAPGSFPAQCGFKVQIVLKGGGCRNALGWYNASDPAALPSAIYPIVPAALGAAPPNGIGCSDVDFCPLATRTTTQAPQHGWADPLPAFGVDIRSDPNWTGGSVGFALMANTNGGQCPETKYSQPELNDKSPTGAPWITALIYHSRADAGAYYLAFEDSPMCAASWRGCMGGTTQALPAGSGNDGDFNDDVFYLTGLNCSLAGGAPDGGADASGSGAAGTAGPATGAGGAGGAAGTVGGGAGAGASAAAGASGAGNTNGSHLGGASGSAGDVGSAGASGSPGTTGGAGATGASGANGSAGAPGTKPGDDHGCGCDLAGRSASLSVWGLLLGGLLLARRRRASAIKRDQ